MYFNETEIEKLVEMRECLQQMMRSCDEIKEICSKYSSPSPSSSITPSTVQGRIEGKGNTIASSPAIASVSDSSLKLEEFYARIATIEEDSVGFMGNEAEVVENYNSYLDSLFDPGPDDTYNIYLDSLFLIDNLTKESILSLADDQSVLGITTEAFIGEGDESLSGNEEYEETVNNTEVNSAVTQKEEVLIHKPGMSDISVCEDQGILPIEQGPNAFDLSCSQWIKEPYSCHHEHMLEEIVIVHRVSDIVVNSPPVICVLANSQGALWSCVQAGYSAAEDEFVAKVQVPIAWSFCTRNNTSCRLNRNYYGSEINVWYVDCSLYLNGATLSFYVLNKQEDSSVLVYPISYSMDSVRYTKDKNAFCQCKHTHCHIICVRKNVCSQELEEQLFQWIHNYKRVCEDLQVPACSFIHEHDSEIVKLQLQNIDGVCQDKCLFRISSVGHHNTKKVSFDPGISFSLLVSSQYKWWELAARGFYSTLIYAYKGVWGHIVYMSNESPGIIIICTYRGAYKLGVCITSTVHRPELLYSVKSILRKFKVYSCIAILFQGWPRWWLMSSFLIWELNRWIMEMRSGLLAVVSFYFSIVLECPTCVVICSNEDALWTIRWSVAACVVQFSQQYLHCQYRRVIHNQLCSAGTTSTIQTCGAVWQLLSYISIRRCGECNVSVTSEEWLLICMFPVHLDPSCISNGDLYIHGGSQLTCANMTTVRVVTWDVLLVQNYVWPPLERSVFTNIILYLAKVVATVQLSPKVVTSLLLSALTVLWWLFITVSIAARVLLKCYEGVRSVMDMFHVATKTPNERSGLLIQNSDDKTCGGIIIISADHQGVKVEGEFSGFQLVPFIDQFGWLQHDDSSKFCVGSTTYGEAGTAMAMDSSAITLWKIAWVPYEVVIDYSSKSFTCLCLILGKATVCSLVTGQVVYVAVHVFVQCIFLMATTMDPIQIYRLWRLLLYELWEDAKHTERRMPGFPACPSGVVLFWFMMFHDYTCCQGCIQKSVVPRVLLLQSYYHSFLGSLPVLDHSAIVSRIPDIQPDRYNEAQQCYWATIQLATMIVISPLLSAFALLLWLIAWVCGYCLGRSTTVCYALWKYLLFMCHILFSTVLYTRSPNLAVDTTVYCGTGEANCLWKKWKGLYFMEEANCLLWDWRMWVSTGTLVALLWRIAWSNSSRPTAKLGYFRVLRHC